MAVIGTPTFEELFNSFRHRKTVGSSGKVAIETVRAYQVYCDPRNTEDEIIEWAAANLPQAMGGYSRTGFEIDEDGIVNPGEYTFVLTFKTSDAEANETEINPMVQVDTTQGRTRMKYSFKTVRTFQSDYIVSTEKQNFKNGINVTSDGVQGCEIVSPSFSWSETWKMPKTTATWEYLKSIAAFRGKTNAAIFRGCPIDTVLFMGHRARQKDKAHMEVVFNFAYSPHEAIPDGQFPGFTGTDENPTGYIKKAWDYIWQYIQDCRDPNKKVAQKLPTQLMVEQVYKSVDFSALGIGTDLPLTANILAGEPPATE